MNKLQKFLLSYIFKDLFRPDNHLRNLDKVYEMIHESWALQFNEDNNSTTDIILAESFLKSQKSFATDLVKTEWGAGFHPRVVKKL